jgi:pyruvate formate lyase activating enzyme
LAVQCELCPKLCIIEPGQSGDCRVRINIDDVLTTVVYGFPCSMHPDPIEKKPLFHFLPGTPILSLATAGCNLHCLNCQNWEISQASPEDTPATHYPPQKLVELAKRDGFPSIAYTYTDPIVYYEYTYDTAKLARQNNIRNVLVTAAYINPEPWQELLKFVDAANIDLKGITEDFYRDVCSGTLKPNLIIPTLNDKPDHLRRLVRWIRANLGSETPMHFSRFSPRYKMRHLPPTSAQTLDMARQIALEEGLHYVYIGNILSAQGQNTYCPSCKGLLIERSGYTILQNRLSRGCCPDCSGKIYGVWQ